MTRRIIPALLLLGLPWVAGCTAGHGRTTWKIGLRLFDVPLVSVVEGTRETVEPEAVAAGARMSGAAPEVPGGLRLLDTSDGLKILEVGPATGGGGAPPSTSPTPPAPTSIPPGATGGTPSPAGPPGDTPPQPPPAEPLKTECLFCGRSLYYTDDGLHELAGRGLDPDICGACAEDRP
jgi:hypothetical protein